MANFKVATEKLCASAGGCSVAVKRFVWDRKDTLTLTLTNNIGIFVLRITWAEFNIRFQLSVQCHIQC
jgi:hypothetical protein